MDYDVLVLGGGAGGIGAARAASRRGAHVAIVQAGPLGGECTFTGCVPSKALIEASLAGEGFEEAMSRAHRATDAIAATETATVLGREGIDVISGWARLSSPTTLDVEGRSISSPRLVVATGAGPALPPIQGIDKIGYLTNENLWDLDSLPSSLAVLGGGAIGAEMAQAFARLGSQVTVIEGLDRLLPKEEPDASAVLAEVFAEQRIEVRLGQRVTRVEPLGESEARAPRRCSRLHLSGGTALDVDAVLISVGRRPNTQDIGLEEVGVQTDSKGFVVTDDHLATTAKGIWAVGDVAGKLQFTHAADEMGRIAAANALSRFRRRSFRHETIPWVTFTSPEVARLGLTEAEGASQGARVAWVPMTEVDRAVVSGQTAGFVKLIVGPRPALRNLAGGQILGATIVAARGGEMIAEVALAMRARMFPARLASTTHAYPTWASAVQQAAAQLFIEIDGRHWRPAEPAVGGPGDPAGTPA
jgi:pyruvate/2-oxoglutarate dehydrogenase complex dihydrolipoamide dehydrogenase (E3) component